MLVADPGLVESANWQHQGQNLVFATASSVFVFSIICICLNFYSLCICNFVGLWDMLEVQIIKNKYKSLQFSLLFAKHSSKFDSNQRNVKQTRKEDIIFYHLADVEFLIWKYLVVAGQKYWDCFVSQHKLICPINIALTPQCQRYIERKR